MSERVYQILYCSRSSLYETAAENKAQLDSILRSSRINNGRVGVTGALFYNTVFFAQVLEGSFGQVQRIFERLQMDARHSDLVVLQSGFVGQRDFPDWSMAFAAVSAEIELPARAGFSRAHTLAAQEVMSFLREVVIKQESWALPKRAVQASTRQAIFAS